MNNNATDWGTIQVGDPMPELTVKPDHTQLFMFSAATWNRHHIHYSKDAALREGLPDIVVQRGLIGNFMVRQVYQWIKHSGQLDSLNWRMFASAVPGDILKCSGKVTQKKRQENGYLFICSLAVKKENGQIISEGEARVSIENTI